MEDIRKGMKKVNNGCSKESVCYSCINWSCRHRDDGSEWYITDSCEHRDHSGILQISGEVERING